MEEVLAEELETLGAQEIEIVKRAVTFEGDLKFLYRCNYESRTALKFIVPIQRFNAINEKQLYNGVLKVEWDKYVRPDQTIAVESVIRSQYFNHSHFVALKTKDAIVDQFREKYGVRPSVDVKNPDLLVNIHIYEQHCTLSIDSTGEPLFKRGYRTHTVDAPLNEVLAAGLIFMTGWEGQRSFFDPMCGSGTLPIEAAMLARRIPPQKLRQDFAFQRWSDYDPELWQQVRAEADAQVRPLPEGIIIAGADESPRAQQIAWLNITNAGLDQDIAIYDGRFEDSRPPFAPGIIITNPPYGERMRKNDIRDFYSTIGSTLKQRYDGYDAWILSGNHDALKHIGLKPNEKIKLFNGALDCHYNHFQIYKGSLRHPEGQRQSVDPDDLPEDFELEPEQD